MVRADVRSRGLGVHLLDECKRRCGNFTLKVAHDNQGAVRFYEANGLTVTDDSGDYWWMSTATE